MKKTLLLMLFALLFVGAKAQVVVWESTSISERWYDAISQKMSDWSSWKDRRVLIVTDVPNLEITIHDNPKQIYDIQSTGSSGRYSNVNETYYSFNCIDEDNKSCTIKISQPDNNKNVCRINIEYDTYGRIYWAKKKDNY